MYSLSKPDDNARTVFIACVNHISDEDLKNRLLQCADFVQDWADNYDKKAAQQQLHTIVQTRLTRLTRANRSILGHVTVSEMKDVYTDHFVPSGTPGRTLYEKLLAMPTRGRCPMCGHRRVSTLDHLLPKAYYPLLSVVPFNLIPSCIECNKSKLGACPTCADDEPLHPYYDNIEADLWLRAKVLQTGPPSIDFYVNPPAHWDQLLGTRVMAHFDSFSINTLYGAQAADELSNIHAQLNTRFAEDGAQGVKTFLQESADSRAAANINSWQTALYTAIATDDWFCNGGFNA